MQRLSYSGLLRQRVVVAGLTLGLLTVMIGVMVDIYLANTQTKIPSSTRALTAPLDPQLDIETVQRIESYEAVSVAGARAYVRQIVQARQTAQQAEDAAVQESLQSLGLEELASASAEQTNTGPTNVSEQVISPFTTGTPTPEETTPETPPTTEPNALQ